ncbi:MAG TPA: vanadium-dependent haloperoxidase [Chitinophagaceae bacterium]|nr:vanadium-dependent haloperoxidase [Chitinophagaceae bacterium]
MKQLLIAINNRILLRFLVYVFLLSSVLVACKKDDEPFEEDNGASQYSSELVTAWIDMQLRIVRTTAIAPPLHHPRFAAYSGIALYEAIVPGMPGYQSLAGQLNGMPSMPSANPSTHHWAISANAALASMNRNFYPNTSAENKASMDSLENALNDLYKNDVTAEIFQQSSDFGKAVAQLVFDWSKTDGSLNTNPPYVPPVGAGLWAPTPPAFANAVGPYWGNNRLFVQGSLNGSAPSPPPVYSTDPNSPYYAMVKEVYDISQSLTPEQQAIAIYYRDSPGYGGGAHYMSILMQIIKNKNLKLDEAAIAYAKTGIALTDAIIGCWKVKYQYNVDRPIKYIREVMNYPAWNAVFGTPPHPDFPSGHSAAGGAVEVIFSNLFGANYSFTNHTYDYLGMAPRTYSSFANMVEEIGKSRVYAGIHYTYSCDQARQEGKKIAQNIESKLKFKK